MTTKGFLDKAYDLRGGEATRRHYDDWADSYDQEVLQHDYSQPKRCADALLALGLAEQASILDVGCGTGLAAVAAEAAGYQCIDGCDYSTGMLAKASDTQAYRRLFEADLNNPPLDSADAHYDAALIVGVFSFGHVSANAMDEILRLLKPGAALVIGINDKFYQEGSLKAKLLNLSNAGAITILSEEEGEHLPGIGLSGWVWTLKKS